MLLLQPGGDILKYFNGLRVAARPQATCANVVDCWGPPAALLRPSVLADFGRDQQAPVSDLVAFAAQASQLPGQELVPVAVVFDVVGDGGDAH